MTYIKNLHSPFIIFLKPFFSKLHNNLSSFKCKLLLSGYHFNFIVIYNTTTMKTFFGYICLPTFLPSVVSLTGDFCRLDEIGLRRCDKNSVVECYRAYPPKLDWRGTPYQTWDWRETCDLDDDNQPTCYRGECKDFEDF